MGGKVLGLRNTVRVFRINVNTPPEDYAVGVMPGIDKHAIPDQPWARDTREILDRLAVDPAQGLSSRQVAARLKTFGTNQLQVARPRHVLAILVDQFRSAVILLLVTAALVSLLFGKTGEGLAILVVILLNTMIGFLTEWRAVRSMEALRRLGHFETVVRRDGQGQRVPADEVVPGDIVIIEAGDLITADLRLLETSKLEANESTLTGESTPVSKQAGSVAPDTLLMDQSSLAFKGTAITRGSGEGVVFATGIDTEIGKISQMVAEARPQETPLERRLNALGQRLVWLMLLIAALVAVAAIVMGSETVLAIEVAIALAVAAIPEGLPIVATIALARGMWRMARKNALIRRLSAVETLGTTAVILTDKTGTLTENRMTVSEIALPDVTTRLIQGFDAMNDWRSGSDQPLSGPELERVDELLQAAVLCTNATIEIGVDGMLVNAVGDPTEVALLLAASQRDIRREEEQEAMPELREVPFESETKAMATFNQAGDGIRISVKGAPETVLAKCSKARTSRGDVPMTAQLRADLERRLQGIGEAGLRALAVATRLVQDQDASPYEDLALLGIVGLEDPPRQGVKEAISRCQGAGVRVVMVTGDHSATARHIAIAVGLIDAESPGDVVAEARSLFTNSGGDDRADQLRVSVIARATPQQKLKLIDLYQNEGLTVAMTGDGVNDAPALKKADIGIAMGIRGTAVAKEAADIVLQDDDFSTIVEAIFMGRVIYSNIRKFVVYLFSCNFAEIMIVGLATFAGAPLPLLPLQILFLNLVTDVFPALALGVGEGSSESMARPPRQAKEQILTAHHWWIVILFGLLMSVCVLGAMAIAIKWLGLAMPQALTVSFSTLAFAQLWHVFNMRDQAEHWFSNEITKNAWVWAAVILCISLVLAAIYIPAAGKLLGLAHPGISGWVLIGVMSLVPVLVGPLIRMAAKRMAKIENRAIQTAPLQR